MSLDIGPKDLRAWAQDADTYGRRWVPVSPATLRALADRLDAPAWECRAGGLRPLTAAQYSAQPPRIQRHYARVALGSAQREAAAPCLDPHANTRADFEAWAESQRLDTKLRDPSRPRVGYSRVQTRNAWWRWVLAARGSAP